jgi:hypothetical protein
MLLKVQMKGFEMNIMHANHVFMIRNLWSLEHGGGGELSRFSEGRMERFC